MDEIKQLLETWKEDGYTNPDSLDKLYQAILILVNKVEELETQIQNLSNT